MQSRADFYYGSWRRDLSGVFNKDVKVPLQEAELVGTSSSNRNLRQKTESILLWENQCILCQKHGGACTMYYLVVKGMRNGMRNWIPMQPRKAQSN
jgi:hypothetical protein